MRHLDYIHFNPVKHGHAVRVRDWPFSSFRRWVHLGAYPVDWAGTVGDEIPGPVNDDGFRSRSTHPTRWLDHQLENDSRFVRRIEQGRTSLPEGRGIWVKDVE